MNTLPQVGLGHADEHDPRPQAPPAPPPVPARTRCTDEDQLRKAWAKRIRWFLKKTVECIVEAGVALEGAKADLRHGRFLMMLKEDLRISPDTAQQFMRIAGDEVLANAANWRHLPPSRSALDALTRLEPEVKLAAIADGRINPNMTAADARKLAAGDASPQPRGAWDLSARKAALRLALDRVLDGCERKDVDELLAVVADARRAYGEPLAPEECEQLLAMRQGLAEAEPGQRFLQFDDMGKVVGALRQPSTYPRWMGPRRTRTEADRKIGAIDKILDGHAAGLLGVDVMVAARGRAGTRAWPG